MMVVLGMMIVALAAVVVAMTYTRRIRRKAYLAQKRLMQMREDFFTNITHEFRTPLTVILGMSRDMQKRDDIPGDISDKASTIERQGNGLLTLINQLMDISKVKSSIGDIDWHNGNITAHIAMIIESYRDYADSRAINLSYIAKEQVEMDFVPDYVSKLLKQFCSQNAFKFTKDHGKIKHPLRGARTKGCAST